MSIDDAFEALARDGGSLTLTPQKDGRVKLKVTMGRNRRLRQKTITCDSPEEEPLGMSIMDVIEELAGTPGEG